MFVTCTTTYRVSQQDDANRRLGQDMLVKNALALKSQFAFFTPLSNIGTHEEDARISLMQ